MNVSPPEYEKVIADCDEAIRHDQNYVKALNRRASALEALQRFEEALRDFTAGAILEKFSNQASAQSVDRVLKKLSETEAQRIIKERGPRLPAFTFISAYLAAFRDKPRPELKGDQPGDAVLLQALDALDAADYPHATSLSSEALDQGLSTEEGKAVALNLRGTFKFLMGDTAGSKADFQESIAAMPSLTQTWVKLASVFMEEENPTEAFACFDKAENQNKDDPDIYYHKGQGKFSNKIQLRRTILTDYSQCCSSWVVSLRLRITIPNRPSSMTSLCSAISNWQLRSTRMVNSRRAWHRSGGR